MTPLGAHHRVDGSTSFLVWAPTADRVELVVDPEGRAETVTMDGPDTIGYFVVPGTHAPPGTRYRYRLHRGDEAFDRPDPASRWQPDGLHGPSGVPDPVFAWTDTGWRNPPLHQHVLYELHVGTFTPEGTFDGVAGRLEHLAELGVTAIELMPVAQFPGTRNWGYDGVLPYAVQNSYGGPDGLRRLVDRAHASGIAVYLDVVYNHLGPEGNHLRDFGPYFTDKYATPWGEAVNVDDTGSDEVRRYIVENAVRWVREFHIDGLRLDAVHAIRDESAVHLLEEIATAVHAEADRLGREVQVIAESELEDPRLVRPVEVGGYGLDGQWLDDVHHAIHVAITDEQDGYYGDYEGLADLERCLVDRYAFAGRYSAYRGRTIGRPGRDVDHFRFVACNQNHDQVGNRMLGERLSSLVDLEGAKLAAATLLLAPFTPMLWMGEEYGEIAPFLYFVSHTEPELVEAVRTGRREEFAAFAWQGEAPDPQAVETFERSRLQWDLAADGRHATLLELYRELLALRRGLPAIADPSAGEARPVAFGEQRLAWERGADGERIVVAVNASVEEGRLPLEGALEVVLDTADPRWGGPGTGPGPGSRYEGGVLEVAPRSVVLLGSGRVGDRTTPLGRSDRPDRPLPSAPDERGTV